MDQLYTSAPVFKGPPSQVKKQGLIPILDNASAFIGWSRFGAALVWHVAQR